MSDANALLPCELNGSSDGCAAQRIEGSMLYGCSKCSRVSRAVLGIAVQGKVWEQPDPVRNLIASLLTTDDAKNAPFYLSTIGSFCRWGLHGVGRTHEYPVEIHLVLDPGDATIVLRWGQLAPDLVPGEWDVERTKPHPAVANTPLFKRVSAVLAQHKLEFHGLEGVGHHLFTGKFQHPDDGKECGIMAQFRYRSLEIMRARFATTV